MRVLILVSAIIGAVFVYSYQTVSTEDDSNAENLVVNEGPEPLTSEEKATLVRYFSQDKLHQIDSLFRLYHERYGFHGSVLIGESGKVLYEEQFGSRDFNENFKIFPETPFQLASVSKPLTAFAILKLIEEGSLALSDDIKCFYPELPYDATVEQLLTHTAGLPNYMWLVENHWKKPYPPYNDDVIAMLSEHALPLHFYPGRRHGYSNTGYVLLASIVESVTGQLFGDYLKETVFEPLNMENSFVFSSAHECRDDLAAKGHRKDRRGRTYQVPLIDLDGPVGDKGIYSTPRDLFKWQTALNDENFISREILERAFEPVKLRNGNTVNYGLGWRLRLNEQSPYVYHNGLWFGFRSSMQRFKESDISFIVLNNSNFSSLNQLLALTRNRLQVDQEPSLAENIVRQFINNPSAEVDAIIPADSLIQDNNKVITELLIAAGLFDKIERMDFSERIEMHVAQKYNIDPVAFREGIEDQTQIGGNF